jgi:hypothetical protein
MSINKTYEDWDSIIIQLNQGETGLANIKIMRQDIEAIGELHGQTIGDIMGMMVETLKDAHANKTNSEENEDAVS